MPGALWLRWSRWAWLPGSSGLVGRGADSGDAPMSPVRQGMALLGLALGSLLLYLTLPGMAVLLALPLAWNVGRGLRGWPGG